jgi:D-alanyl-D-alanine carboxypeptidase (penicillin-binding protein 5/6)
MPIRVFASSTETVSGELASKAKSAILIEASTGKVLYEKNSHEKLAPASMTKMMSMLLILEHIESGALSWDDMVTASENASSMGGSQILLETGEQMSVRDLFKGVAIGSGNDAVVALAEAVSGTVDTFVEEMNAKAKELGLNDTLFQNPHGLDSENHYSSAYDMAMIAMELVKHEEVLEFTSTYEDYLRKGTDREFWLVNTNRLVKFNPIVDGLKTGYTTGAGYCLTATGLKNDMRLIATVMGEETITDRSNEVTSLLDYGYANYKVDKLIDSNTVIDTVSLDLASQNLNIVAKEDLSRLSKKTDKLGEITYQLNMSSIKLPLKKGDTVGNVDIYLDGKKVETVDVTVLEDTSKVSFGNLFMRYLKDIMQGKMIVS